MEKIYGGFKKNEKNYSYGSVREDFNNIRSTILVDDIAEGLDFMANYFGKSIPSAPGFSWEYEDAMNHDRREQLKSLISEVEEVEEVEEVVEAVAEEEVICSCGHSVPKSMVMFSSTGSCCPECYDRMSF